MSTVSVTSLIRCANQRYINLILLSVDMATLVRCQRAKAGLGNGWPARHLNVAREIISYS